MPSAAHAKSASSTFWAIFLEVVFDSSVLVPVFYADHPHHAPSTKAFLGAGKEDFCALRTLGEVYSTLTGLPVRPRITGADGIDIIRQIRDRLTVVSLSEQEYFMGLEAASRTVVGGAIYDAPSNPTLPFCSHGMCVTSFGLVLTSRKSSKLRQNSRLVEARASYHIHPLPCRAQPALWQKKIAFLNIFPQTTAAGAKIRCLVKSFGTTKLKSCPLQKTPL